VLVAARSISPAIARALDAGLDQSTPFLAMEFAPGDPLDALLRQSGAWPASRAVPVLREVAAAIDAAWAAGMGHGALHPRDIFVSMSPPDVRVTGVGIVQALETVGVKAPVRRPYSAPEIGNDAWDVRADVYSLGVVAFEMLSGQRPMGPDDEAAALAAELPADARAALRRVLGVAMADAASDRYENAMAFADAIATATGVLAPSPDEPREMPPVAASAGLLEFPPEPAPEPTPEPMPEPQPEPLPERLLRRSGVRKGT